MILKIIALLGFIILIITLMGKDMNRNDVYNKTKEKDSPVEDPE